jgi:hypothetical protein
MICGSTINADTISEEPLSPPENFPLAVKHLLTPRVYRQKVLLDLIVRDNDRAVTRQVLCKRHPHVTRLAIAVQ